MSKERLEEIETQLDRFMTPANKMVLLRDDAEWLIKYAKEQAERVQELRMFQKHTESLASVVADLEQGNKRYRETINNINEKATLFGANEQVYEAIQNAIKALEGDPHES